MPRVVATRRRFCQVSRLGQKDMATTCAPHNCDACQTGSICMRTPVWNGCVRRHACRTCNNAHCTLHTHRHTRQQTRARHIWTLDSGGACVLCGLASSLKRRRRKSSNARRRSPCVRMHARAFLSAKLSGTERPDGRTNARRRRRHVRCACVCSFARIDRMGAGGVRCFGQTRINIGRCNMSKWCAGVTAFGAV